MELGAAARRVVPSRLRRRIADVAMPIDERREVDIDLEFGSGSGALLTAVRPFTLTGIDRIFTLRDAVEHVVRNEVPGALVECGVWRGGSAMVMLHTLQSLAAHRPVHLFDTFEGMTPPTAVDVDLLGQAASDLMDQDPERTGTVWARATLAEVRANVESVGHTDNPIHYVVGPVEQTIPGAAPERIALLRLDTDWYESTRHELAHLYHRVSPGGVVIIDDYGHFRGAQKAVDEFWSTLEHPPFLTRIDYTARLAVKPV